MSEERDVLIYLFRHAEHEGGEVTPAGYNQINRAIETHLGDRVPDLFVSSPVGRARQSADHVRLAMGPVIRPPVLVYGGLGFEHFHLPSRYPPIDEEEYTSPLAKPHHEITVWERLELRYPLDWALMGQLEMTLLMVAKDAVALNVDRIGGEQLIVGFSHSVLAELATLRRKEQRLLRYTDGICYRVRVSRFEEPWLVNDRFLPRPD